VFIATLIAADRLSAGDISQGMDKLRTIGCDPQNDSWIEPEIAADIHFATYPNLARTALEDKIGQIDVIVQHASDRQRKLIVADMDSTMITVECIDELADYAGIKTEIAAVTERAMRGEIDFEAALRSRVSLLKGLPERAIVACLAERVKIMPGAKALVQTVRAHDGHAVLVSGGFTRFADPVAQEIGFDKAIANCLGIANGVLTGTVEGAIVGAEAKRDTLYAMLTHTGFAVEQSLAIGDGANDIPMIEAAGLGVAYHAKPKTAAAAAAKVSYNDLSALLYAMGYPRSAWAKV
jgi:phosphoserine phosphatase